MSKALITESILTDIANAIIDKGGASAALCPPEMAAAIRAIGASGYTAQVTKEGSGNYCWVEYDTIYNSNCEFAFTPGDILTIHAGGHTSGRVYVDDVSVANSGQDNSVTYNFTLPENSISIRLVEDTSGHVYVTNPSVEYNANGTFVLPGFGKVIVDVT